MLSYLGPASKFDLGGRWVFFDLRAFREKLESSLSSEERARREKIAKLTPQQQFEAEFKASSENFIRGENQRRFGKVSRIATVRTQAE